MMSFGGGGKPRLKNHTHGINLNDGGFLHGEVTGVTVKGKNIPLEVFL